MTAPVFSTLGCRLNACETEAMRELARREGVGDLVVVNTCAVTAEAVRKARREIRRLRRAHPGACVAVTGCAAQIDPDSFAAMDEVDAVLGNAEKMRPETWRALAENAAGRVQVGDIMAETTAAADPAEGFATRSRAFVQIQNGCDHRCTFCVIPYGRGNARSTPAAEVVDRVRRLAERGYGEVVLTGVDITAWGGDLPGGPRLGDLVLRVLRLVPDLPRLRISSIDSIEADARLMQAIAEEPRLMPHLHLSLQHGDDMILKRMKRRHSRSDAVRFVEEVRRLRPETAFGADLIAGFPTESQAHFESTLSMIEECGLTWLHVFPYSPRPGTPAARMPQVDGRAIRERAARLRAAGQRRVALHLDGELGERRRILMEGPSSGRTEQFAEVEFPEGGPESGVVTATIRGRSGDRLVA